MSAKQTYLTCVKGGNHQGQQLNTVCLNQACRNENLCCCACIEQFHQGHPSKTLKKIISNAEQVLAKGPTPKKQKLNQEINREELLKIVNENQAKTINKFKMLRFSINATLVQIEQNLISYFKQMNETIKNPVTQQDPLKTLQSALKQLQISSQYNKTASSLQKILSQLNRVGQDGRIQQVQNHQDALEKLVSQSNKEISDLVDLRLTDIRNILSQSSNFLFDSISNAHSLWQNPLFRFDKKLCSETITVQDNSTVIAGGDYEYHMALMQPQINLHGSTQIFRFKIAKLTANWIAVGMAHKKTVQSKNYFFDYNQLGHGAYMVSANAGSLSNDKFQLNNKVRAFKFQQGDVISCIVDPEGKKIYFVKQANMAQLVISPRQIYQIPFVPNPNDPLHPCVAMFYMNNSVQYVPATNVSQIPKYDYLLSQTSKHSQLQITNGKSVLIKNDKTDGYRACLANKTLEDGKWNSYKQFSFRITNCYEDWIGIGICHIKTASQKSYQFIDFEQPGHGYYMISSNRGVWSNHNSEQNNILKCWKFRTGDVIECQVQFGEGADSGSNRIIFKRNKDKYILPFKCISDDKLYPCVMLHYPGDEVTIQPSF